MASHPLFKVTGDDKIIAAFKRLGPVVTDEIVKPAAKAAATTIRDAIRMLEPIRTGALHKSTKVKTSKGPAAFRGRKIVSFAVITGQTRPTAGQQRKGTRIPFYAFMQERGYHTGGKRIRKAGKVLGYKPRAETTVVRFIPGRWFVRRALKANEATVQARMLTRIYTGIDRIASRS
jgi:HK97 gp10 family phage protein